MGYVEMVSLEIIKMHQFGLFTIDSVEKLLFYIQKRKKEEKVTL